MDGFLEQEVELENQIETYRAQLNLIKGNSSENGDTDQIIADLTQLIALTEENLMELKKQKLLMMLHVPDTGHEMQPLAIDPSTEGEGKVEEEDEEELRDDLVGMKCSAPLKESWGGESHHNAVILCREEVEPPSGDDDFEVHVLFTQPLYNAMKPCSFYLEGSCKFSQEECKFSHGHVVQFSRLRPFQEADHSVAHVGGKCLAKHEDGLWYQGIISSLGEEYVVYFPSLSLTAQVREEGVLPLESSDESSNGESFGEEEGEEVVEWRPSGLQCALGEWERHTTGIGSKLLSKMGYVVGKGLGKEGQGRVEPVEIIILPAGKSLDVCAELREAKKVRMVDGVEVVKRRKKKRRKKCGKASSTQDKTGDMFQFLNTKVFSRGTSESGRFQLEKEEKAPPSGNAGNLNVQLFKVQEEIKAMNKRKQSLRESLQRHQKRKDRQLERQAREKLAAAESQLQHLHRQEKSIEKNISTKSERKKLSVF